MERAALEHVEEKIREEVTRRFPDAPVDRVSLLQYGDEPIVEPGELMVRVTLTCADDEDERERTIHDFERGYHDAIREFREDLDAKLPEARRLEFRVADGAKGPAIVLARPGRQLESRAAAGGDLTPVMARLGSTDLETLDTLITAGVAPNRAEAVRWALARIRERPAYQQLVARTREIEELKAQF